MVVDDTATARLDAGHVWVYRSQILRGRCDHGTIVRVADPRGRVLGHAMCSQRSAITLRLVTRGDRPVDEALVRERIAGARRRRAGLVASRPHPHAYRLVHAEADGLPAIVIDVYETHLVVQTLTLAAERLLPVLEAALVAEMRPRSILLRNDPAVRELEGLPRVVKQLSGATPETVTVREGNIHLSADLHRGQKTGLFLDQAENRLMVERLGGRRVLDCFCYDGAFALQAAASAEEVLAIDISGDVLARARHNVTQNGFDNVELVEGNSFDLLRSMATERRRFDLVVLDPPAFARNRAALDGALRGYKEINLRALRLVEPGGHLVTSSCSYALSEARFGQLLREAAGDAGRDVEIIARRGQASDHPALLGVPETSYLKCWILGVGGWRSQARHRSRPRRLPAPAGKEV